GHGAQGEIGSVAGLDADELAPACRPPIGDDGLPFGHDLMRPRLAPRRSEEGFEEPARSGAAGLFHGGLQLAAAERDVAGLRLGREAVVSGLQLADLAGDGAALGGAGAGEEAEGAALAADGAIIP